MLFRSFEHIEHQIVRQGARRRDPLLGIRDRRGFNGTNPNWQVSLAVGLTEQDYGGVRRHLHPDADDLETDHASSVTALRHG